jgi:pre-mRNA cleavage complex 2 protein Pcf11
VLDSIVKNVGTPYTVYFGRNLYNTFMNAYTLVDGNVRKKLDETLKTWREPVPGSLSSTPVFRLDITQRIVDALSKARLAAQQNRSQQTPLLGSRIAISQTQPFRNTPTPPQNLPNYGRPTYTTQAQPPSRNGFPAPYTAPHVCPSLCIYVGSADNDHRFLSLSRHSILLNLNLPQRIKILSTVPLLRRAL